MQNLKRPPQSSQRPLNLPDLPKSNSSPLRSAGTVVRVNASSASQNHCDVAPYDSRCCSESHSNKLPTQYRNGTIDLKTLKRSDRQTTSENKPAWLTEILRDWKNPVFPTAERTIKTYEEGLKSRLDNYEQIREDHESKQYTITKGDLDQLQFIAQVDTKFLLFKAQQESSTSLILVDQHAADERIRVEAFLSSYWQEVRCNQVCQTILPEVKTLLFSAREADTLGNAATLIKQWGFDIQVPVKEENGFSVDHVWRQVSVSAVPQLLADRLIADDRLLQLVLLSFLELERVNAKAESAGWTTILRNCPDAILDLINSRACRGQSLLAV